MTSPLDAYKHYAARYQHLLDTPKENLATPQARKEHIRCMHEERAEMHKHEGRLTFDQKKELGILRSQVVERVREHMGTGREL